MIVVRTQVKDILKEINSDVDNISNDYMEKLDQKVKQLVIDSVKRAKENNRRTVMGRDL